MTPPKPRKLHPKFRPVRIERQPSRAEPIRLSLFFSTSANRCIRPCHPSIICPLPTDRIPFHRRSRTRASASSRHAHRPTRPPWTTVNRVRWRNILTPRQSARTTIPIVMCSTFMSTVNTCPSPKRPSSFKRRFRRATATAQQQQQRNPWQC